MKYFVTADPHGFFTLMHNALFEQAYESEEALISEMKLLYGNFLPKDFDYRARLASLCAVVWG